MDSPSPSKRRKLENGDHENSAPAPTPAAIPIRRRKRPAGSAPPPLEERASVAQGPSTCVLPPVDGFSSDACARRALASVPELRPIGELVREFPHLAMDTDCSIARSKLADGGATSSSSATPTAKKAAAKSAAAMPDPEQVKVLHFECSQERPAALEVLIQQRKNLIAPVDSVKGQLAEVSAAAVSRALREEKLVLPLFTAEHEASQMVSAPNEPVQLSNGKQYKFPQCMRGRQCVGYATLELPGEPKLYPIEGLDERVVFMRAMTPEQWARFKADPSYSPPGQGPCVLCHRATLSAYVHHVRLLNASSSSVQLHSFESESPKEVFQLWYNTVDREGGYWRPCVLMPRPGEVVLEPLAEMCYQGLRAKRVGALWVVDQSAMVWRPGRALAPDVGEQLSVF